MLTLIRNIFLIIYIGIFSLNFIIGGDEVYVDKTTLSETSECIIIQLKTLVDIN